tara:strand:- start:454 stop:1005 length:552 start_codon:yes stop_codon:yes gene_type:complete
MNNEIGYLTDFTALHESMVLDLKSKIKFIKTVEAYDPTSDETGPQHSLVKTPAALIELTELRPGKSLGDGRQSFRCEFIFHCILSTTTKNVELEIRNYAAAVAKAIHKNRWGFESAVEQPSDIGAYPGVFKSGDKGFESWVVSFSQNIYLGNIGINEESIPEDVFYSMAPLVGEDNKQAYQKG